MDFFAPLISPVVECIGGSCATVVRQIGYIKNLERNFEKLNEEARTLFDKKKDTEHEIKRHGNNKKPTNQCRSWLDKVNEIQNQVSSIEEEYSQGDKRCLSRWCLHVSSSWKLGRRIVLKTDAILDLCEKAKFEGGVVVDALPPIAETKLVHTIKEGTSAELTLQKIFDSVRDPRKYKLGIWGMGGVGKTTVMTHLNNLPEIAEMFDIVIWVTVSQEYSTRNLQIDILDRLGLKELSEGVNVERVASRLLQELTNRKFLLLMDDLWKEVDLQDIGVPCPNKKGCKIVFTTRYHDVCRKMEINEEIKVETLSEKEAWNLFRGKVGEVADSPIIRPLATIVVHECGGLPLAIDVIGASLRMEDNAHVWENAVQELSSPDTSDIYDMEERVFRRLKFSFDRLEDKNVKDCFLYAALYPEDHKIKKIELIEYWRAEGLIHSGSSLASVRNKGHVMVKRLIDASLLLKIDESNGCVLKMHDVIRDLALRITSRMESGCRFLVRANKMIGEPPKNEEWENVNRISLMRNEIGSLPERPNCPTLLTLLLQGNRKLRTIPKSFFDQMHALRVLDLSETTIKSLPHSICHLVNLRGLYLKYCRFLKTLPPEIGKLTRIEVLDAHRTHINSLPTEIGQLSGLKVLHVTFSMERDENEEDEKVSGGIISRLSQLEQLIIDIRFSGQDTCAEAVMEEVSCLKRLTSLEFGFPKMEYLECFLQRSHPWKKGIITSFHFVVGQYQYRDGPTSWLGYSPENERMNRMLTFRGYDSIPNAIIEVLRHADCFMLLGHKSVHSLCEFGMQNMSGLTDCRISECDAMGIVVDGNQLVEAALPKLEYLVISHMPNLRSIWVGYFPPGSLNCLRSLELFECEKLKNIFSREIIQQLSNLECLTVISCSALEVVISDEEIGVESDCVLPKLKRLFLQYLPSLVRILKLGRRQLLNCSSLEEIWVVNCPNLKSFRQGRSSQRLISDWRRGSGRHAVGAGYSKSRLDLPMNGDKEHISKDVTTSSNLDERNEIKTAKIESEQTSVKALIDDEMSTVRSSVKQITRTAVQQTPPYLECRCHISNNHTQTCKSRKIASNLHLHGSRASASLDPKSSFAPSLMERPSLNEQEMHPNHTNGIDSCLACRSSTYTDMQHLQKHVVKEKLNEATESFLNQKLKDAKRLIRDGATHQSKEFMDALELLNSNKELFLKLLQDPNSLLVKHIEDLRKAQSERVSKEEIGNSMHSEKPISHKKFSKQNIHNFFRRKDKTEDRSKSPTKVSDSSFASNRIVVLKPSPESSQNSTSTRSQSSIQRSHYILRKEIESERVATNFSIREITRKLRNAIGESRKEQHCIPTEGVFHRIPYGHQDSTEISKRITVKNQSRVETEVARKNSDFCTNPNTTAIGRSHKKGAAVYKEGETADTRNICDIHENSITRRVPRTISLPEYSKSPRFSPGRDSGPTFVHGQMRFSSPYENFRAGNESTWQQFKKEMSAESSSPWRPKLETYSFIDCNNNDREPLHVPNSDSGILKDHITDAKIHMNIGSSPKGSIVIEREADVEDSKPLVVPSKSDRVITTVDNSNAAAATDKVGAEGSYEHFRMDSPERPILASTLGSFSGSPLLIHRINVPGINEKPERPSPVSVLEPFYIEGVISPASPQQASTAEFAEEPQPIHHEQQESSPPITTLDPKIGTRTCLEGKEEEFEYVRNVMEASGFNYSEFFGRWHSSEQPLSPSLFDQVEVSSAHLSSDRKLLFDCINEVLVEIYERFFSCSPWISFVKTNIWPIPVRKHVIQEVWQGIHWHLLPQFPRTLDQIIGKDMAKAGSWMDLRFDVEAVSSEMGEGILEKIMEEMILELWD